MECPHSKFKLEGRHMAKSLFHHGGGGVQASDLQELCLIRRFLECIACDNAPKTVTKRELGATLGVKSTPIIEDVYSQLIE